MSLNVINTDLAQELMSHLAIETVICLGFLVEQNKVSTILAV
jgi:hypothetical protein